MDVSTGIKWPPLFSFAPYPYYDSPYFAYLIDPDWAAVKEAYLQMWNESRVVTFDIHSSKKVTFDDLLGNATSYKLMGKDNLADAKKELRDDTHEWSYEVDLSNYLEYRYYSEEDATTKYVKFNKYIIRWVVAFTSGGLLDHFEYNGEFGAKLKDGTKIVSTFVLSVSRGGADGLLGTGLATGFELLTIVLGLMTVSVALSLKARKPMKKR